MPEALVKAVQLTGKLLETRDQLRRLSGDRFPEHVEPYREVLRRLVAESGREVLACAIKAAGQAADEGQGMAALWFLAAAVEEVEPCVPAPAGEES